MRANGLKKTRQRDVILNVFLQTDGHTSLDELLARVQTEQPGVGYATVYRAMKVFVAAHVASERHFGDGAALYEPSEQDQHHDHMICTSCGRIFEFEDDTIEEQQHVVAHGLGLRLTNHRMTLWGECLDEAVCAASAESKS
jgi:Fur family ferric uptake transcriptional regulator